MTISERIAANAKYICKEQGKAYADMEAAVGVSQGYLSRIKGKKMLSIDTGYALAEYLGVSMEDLVCQNLLRKRRIEELKAELAELEREDG